MATRVKIGPYR